MSRKITKIAKTINGKVVLSVREHTPKEKAIEELVALMGSMHSNELQFSSQKRLCYTAKANGEVYRYDPMIRTFRQMTQIAPALLDEGPTHLDLVKAMMFVANSFDGAIWVATEEDAMKVRGAVFNYAQADLNERFAARRK